MITIDEAVFHKILDEVKEHFDENYARLRRYDVHISCDIERAPTINFDYEVLPEFLRQGGD